MNDLINKVAKEIAENRSKIIDDFLKTYVAANTFGKTEEEIVWFIQKVKLVEKVSRDGLTRTYSLKFNPTEK